MPTIGENESGLWPTPKAHEGSNRRQKATPAQAAGKAGMDLAVAVRLWPTPRAEERGQYNSADNGVALSRAVKFWPTPVVDDSRNANIFCRTEANQHGVTLTDAIRRDHVAMMPTPTATRRSGLQSHGVNVISGSLNPEWVEWLMGYPIGHTACVDSETPSSRKSRKR
jgi:DNA (cytosine-5)-methyltransferase 1